MKHSWNRASKRKHRAPKLLENSGGRGDTLSRALAGRVSERPINRSVKDDRDHWLLTLHPLSYFSSVYQPTWPVNSGTHSLPSPPLLIPITHKPVDFKPTSPSLSGSLGLWEWRNLSSCHEWRKRRRRDSQNIRGL